MGRKGGRRRVKKRTHKVVDGPGAAGAAGAAGGAAAAKAVLGARPGGAGGSGVVVEQKKVPRSIVVRHGRTARGVTELVEELRKVMMPHTALKLKERKNASLKDYTAVAAPLDVTHLLVLSQGKRSPNLKVARLPLGPTLTFRVTAYALGRQIRAAQKHHFDPSVALLNPPLVVLNNFEGAAAERRHLALTSLTFQSMFPAINVRQVKLASCKRVLLLHLNEEDETIELRHYLVRTTLHGASRVIKRVLRAGVPDLGAAEDVAEILDRAAGYATSDSEVDDDAKVQLPPSERERAAAAAAARRAAKRGAAAQVAAAAAAAPGAAAQSVVKLSEIGPRLTLKLIKVEDSVFTGEVQYHAIVKRTQEEEEALRKYHAEKAAKKQERKAEQDANVKRKLDAKEDKRARKKAKREGLHSTTGGAEDGEGEKEDESEDEDDAAAPAGKHGADASKYGQVDDEEDDGGDGDDDDDDNDDDDNDEDDDDDDDDDDDGDDDDDDRRQVK
jgi:ribosome biogenesis protein SSF1/2